MKHSRIRWGVGAVSAGTALVFVLSGCASGSTPQASKDANTFSVIYSVDKIDENQTAYIKFMTDEVAVLNAKGKHITFESYDANGSVDKQISDVQTALQKHPDVMIFSAVDPAGSLPAVQAAKDAGVKTIDFRPSDPEPDVYDVAFGASEKDYAAATTDWMKSLLDADPKLTLNVGLIYGAAAQTPQLIREDGVKAFATANPDRVKIIGEQYGNWQTDIAQNTTADWLQSHPEVNLISAANSTMGQGASNALTTAGVRNKVLVSGYDINQSSLDAVKSGAIDFTTGVLGPDYGQIIDVAAGLMDGSFTDKVYSIKPVYSVTTTNVDDVISKLKG
ncbi:sugar ABC transporter substrate-binding protein [Subtercola frigoramans]|uniref:ABC-type sugar transport system substrate-binding protein n=1 Tax=Subtercola frigoramans TaxID=120298 RepID=A0ABS2L078_9MICO|nr:sugar ABC transporter substrate-binding protein [Subtercola frigoramans]MBM7470482.1 ABC-type sugar transport system substrate-binding protein [Subtercola frigoramans]